MCTTPHSALHCKIKGFAASIQWKSLKGKPVKIIPVFGRQKACLENLFGIQRRQVRAREAVAESVMHEPHSPGIKEVHKVLGGADPWDLGRRGEQRLPARGEHYGGRERETRSSGTQE